MKLVLFSDIHGNKYSFDVFCDQLGHMEYDKVYFLGDVFGYYYYTDYIISKMIEKDFFCLLGNHDKMLLDTIDGKYDEASISALCEKYGSVYCEPQKKISEENLDFLRTLKSEAKICTNNCYIGMFHGTPEDPLNGRLYPDTEITNFRLYDQFDFVILGHTHHKMVRKVNKTIILNPGSLGQQRDGKGCSYVILDTITKDFFFYVVEYEKAELIKDIEKFDDGLYKLTEVLLRSDK